MCLTGDHTHMPNQLICFAVGAPHHNGNLVLARELKGHRCPWPEASGRFNIHVFVLVIITYVNVCSTPHPPPPPFRMSELMAQWQYLGIINIVYIYIGKGGAR
jgi:hypothetical protein